MRRSFAIILLCVATSAWAVDNSLGGRLQTIPTPVPTSAPQATPTVVPYIPPTPVATATVQPAPTAVPTYAYTAPTPQATYSYVAPTPQAMPNPTPQPTYAYVAPTPQVIPTPMPTLANPTPQPTFSYIAPTPITVATPVPTLAPPTPQPTFAYVAPTRVPALTAVYAPASLAANSSRTDTVTVTGIVTGRPVAANPGVNPATGCVIAGVWASAANTVSITWRNTFAASTACQTPSSTWTFVQP